MLPEGIHLVLLPPYSPELQPAERSWELTDEPSVNRSFDTLDKLGAVLVQGCQVLSGMTDASEPEPTFTGGLLQDKGSH